MTLSLLTQDDNGHLWAAVGSDQPGAERLVVQDSVPGTLLVLQGESDLPHRHAMRRCLRAHPAPGAFLRHCAELGELGELGAGRQLHLMDRSGASRRLSGAALAGAAEAEGGGGAPLSVASNALPAAAAAAAAAAFRACRRSGGAAPFCAHRAVAQALPERYAVSVHGPHQ